MKTKIERLNKIIRSGVKGVADQKIPIGKIEFIVLEEGEISEGEAGTYQTINPEMTVKELLEKKAGEGYRPASFYEVAQEIFLVDCETQDLSCIDYIGYLEQFIKDEKEALHFTTVYNASHMETDHYYFLPINSPLSELNNKRPWEFPALPFIKEK